MRLLIVEPVGGLGNRMRAIDSAVVLAREMDARLRVVWTIDKDLAAPFGSLFEPIPEIAELVEINVGDAGRARLRHYWASCNPDVFLKTRQIPDYAVKRLDFHGLGADGALYMRTWSRFRVSERPFELFVPAAGLRATIDRMVARFDDTIGVHIRRADNRSAKATSVTKFFIEQMARAHRDAGARSFFVATDDPRELRRLKAKFPGAILSHPKRSLDRRQAVAAEDAVIDLFCLARTKHLLGSYGSSFSRTSAEMGSIPLHIVGLGIHSRRRRLIAGLQSLFRL